MQVKKQRSGFTRLFALLVTVVCMMTILPISGLTAFASEDTHYIMRVFAYDSSGKKHYLGIQLKEGEALTDYDIFTTVGSATWRMLQGASAFYGNDEYAVSYRHIEDHSTAYPDANNSGVVHTTQFNDEYYSYFYNYRVRVSFPLSSERTSEQNTKLKQMAQNGTPVKLMQLIPRITIYHIVKHETYTAYNEVYSADWGGLMDFYFEVAEDSFTMSFDLDGGYYNSWYDRIEPITGRFGSDVNFDYNVPIVKPGYTLAGWRDEDGNVHDQLPETMPCKDTHWKAVWKSGSLITYYIKYLKNADEATGELENQVVHYDEVQQLRYPNYYYPHHKFVEWWSSPDNSGGRYPVEEEIEGGRRIYYFRNLTDKDGEVITLYAHWSEDTYNIHVNEKDSLTTQVIVGDNSHATRAYSGDQVTLKLTPNAGFEMTSLELKPDHGNAQLYQAVNGDAFECTQEGDSLYDDVQFVKNEDGSWNVTFTMKNDIVYITAEADFVMQREYVDENGVWHQPADDKSALVNPVKPNDSTWYGAGTYAVYINDEAQYCVEEPGWYMVYGEVTLKNRVTVDGDVNLILADGAKLIAPEGIRVTEGKSLTIYGQQEGTGVLEATVSQFGDCAVIGADGEGAAPCGEITLYGGNVIANNGNWGAAIGGGISNGGGKFSMYGGTLDARITNPSGGNAEAVGHGSVGHTPLNSKTEKTEAYVEPHLCLSTGKGQIPTHYSGRVSGLKGRSVYVSRCTHDNGFDYKGGCYFCHLSKYNQVSVSNSERGSVEVQAETLDKQGYIQVGDTVTLTVHTEYGHTFKSIKALSNNKSLPLTESESGSYTFAMPDTPVNVEVVWDLNEYSVSFDANGGSGNMDAISGQFKETTILSVADFTAPEGKAFFSWCTSADGNGKKYSAGQTFTFTEDTTLYAQWSEGLYYINENGEPSEPDGIITEITSDNHEWNSANAKFYVAAEDTTIDARVSVSGDVKLILCTGATLNVNSGINVPKGSSLTIYSQNEDTGKLYCNVTADGIQEFEDEGSLEPLNDWTGAGIGTGSEDCGTITICGGEIFTVGGYCCAGIGSGEYSSYEAINIYGGKITAIGGSRAAGIGSGSWEGYYYNTEDVLPVNTGTITIDGKRECTVNAYGTDDGTAGIGGGLGQACGIIDISNATVNAFSGGFGTAIGNGLCEWFDREVIKTDDNGEAVLDEDGYPEYEYIWSPSYEKGGTIRIHSGNITADGRNGGTGIGCGVNVPDFGTIEISGGTIHAYGSSSESAVYEGCGAGIGGNARTSKGTIVITGGNITASGSDFGWYGLASPGIGASEATVSIGGSAEITTSHGINGTISLSGSAVVFGSVNETNLTRDGFIKLNYDANGANGGLPATIYAPNGRNLTVAEQGDLTKEGETFTGWNTAENGNGTAYAANEEIALSEDITLYAQWFVPVTYTKVEAKDASYTEAGNIEYYSGSDGKFYTLVNDTYVEMPKNSWVIPKLIGTEVQIYTVDVNGIITATTVYAETFTNADYSVAAVNLDGYNFIGWKVNGESYTTADTVNATIEALVKAGTSVTVETVYEKKPDKFNVTVTNGKLSTGKTSGKIQVSNLVTVKANAPAAGKKFSHWMRNGVKVSSNSTYSFQMPSQAVNLEAVFVNDTTAVQQVGTAIIESVKPDAANQKVSFVSVLNVPKNGKFVKGGLVATQDAAVANTENYDAYTYKKLTTKATANTKNIKYTWTKSNATSTWYVRAYLVYKDASGTEHTVFGDVVSASCNS